MADIYAVEDALKVPDSHLLSLDHSEDDPSQMIGAAIVVGDPFNADHVSVTVPGVGSTTRDSIVGMTSQAEQLRSEAQKVAREAGESQNIAAVAWMGYQPPPSLLSSGSATDNVAKAAAPKLGSFLQQLDGASHNPNQTLALFGDSYGSMVSGLALRDGAGSVVDNAVMYGSSGFGATSTGQLGMNDNSFFVMTADGDKSKYLGSLAPLHGWGSNPDDVITTNPFSTGRYRFPHLETDEGFTPLPSHEHKAAAHGNSEYGQDAGDRMTGYNLATILLNRPDLAVEKTPSWLESHVP